MVTWTRIAFPFMDERYSTVCMYCSSLVLSSVHGNLTFSHVLAITNNVSMNTLAQVSVWIRFCFSWVEVMSHMLILSLTFLGTARFLTKVATLFYIPTCNV